MFIAKDGNGARVDIDKAVPGNTYFCPDCGAELVQRRGGVRIHHFAHKSLGDCVPPREPMTEWHLGWQRLFPEDCREVMVVDDDGNKRRADVKIGRCVLEFQHSVISDDAWRSRSEFYMDQNIEPIWIYDRRNSTPYADLVNRKGSMIFSGLGKRSAVGREFIRTGELDEWSIVVLDYGSCCVLCYNFHTKGSCGQGYKPGECANAVLIDRKMFVNLATEWGGMKDGYDLEYGSMFDAYTWIEDNQETFVGCLHWYFGWSTVARPVLDKLGKYVLSRGNYAAPWNTKYFRDVNDIRYTDTDLVGATAYGDVGSAREVNRKRSLLAGLPDTQRSWRARCVDASDVFLWLLVRPNLWRGLLGKDGV